VRFCVNTLLLKVRWPTFDINCSVLLIVQHLDIKQNQTSIKVIGYIDGI